MEKILDRLLTLRLRVRRRLLRRRRLWAAIMAGAAVLLALEAVSPPPPHVVPVWTAARDLPAGAVLHADDLALVDFRPGSVPSTTIKDPGQVAGRVLAAPLGAGQPVSLTQTVGAGLLAGYPGKVAVPVRVTDPDVAALLRVGDRVSLLATDPQGEAPATVLATDVAVVAVPRPGRDDAGSALPGRLVVVTVDPGLADTVAAAAARLFVTAVWNR